MIRAYVLVTASAGRAQHVAEELRGKDGIVLVDAITASTTSSPRSRLLTFRGSGVSSSSGSSPRMAWSRRSRASRSDPGLAPLTGGARLGGLAALYATALGRLRGSAHLRASLVFWTLLG